MSDVNENQPKIDSEVASDQKPTKANKAGRKKKYDYERVMISANISKELLTQIKEKYPNKKLPELIHEGLMKVLG